MTAPRPRVSVVVPGRNVENYVTDTLVSLTRQLDDPRDLEVVVVVDGSTDATADIAESFTSRLPRLTVLTNPEPVGPSDARNQGVAATTGQYVAFLDADDWLAPGRLEALADAMDALRVDFLRTDHVTVQGRRRELRRAPQAVRGVALDPRGSILPADTKTMVDYPYSWAGIFDRALADDGLLAFPEGLRTAEDRPWVWRLFLEARRYAVVDAPAACYRRGLPGSLSQTFDERQLDVVPALHRTFDVVEADRDADVWLPKLTLTAIALLAHHLRRSPSMPRGAREALRAGAKEVLARAPVDVLAYETARMHPGRAWVLHGLLPRPDRTVRHRPPASVAVGPQPSAPPPPPPTAVRVVVASTVEEARAGLDALAVDGADQSPGALLLVAPDGTSGELGPALSGFDRAIDLASVLDPVPPSEWNPRDDRIPELERLLRGAGGLGPRPVHLAVPALDAPAARAVARILHDAALSLYAADADDAERVPLLPLDLAQRVVGAHHGSDPPLGDRELARARAYVDAPDRLPWLRAHAETFLATASDQVRRDSFDGRRLAGLGLPGGTRSPLRERLRREAGLLVRHPLTGLVLERSGLLRLVDAVRRA